VPPNSTISCVDSVPASLSIGRLQTNLFYSHLQLDLNMATSNGTNGTNGHSASPICSVEEFLSHEYDFVICGGGTAGLAVAARLTENPDVKVGVIEAGKYRIGDMLVDTPGLFLQMLGNDEYDWNFRTAPQKGNGDIVHHMPRGKLLGGSSGINYMM
jgi:hypothetical protein